MFRWLRRLFCRHDWFASCEPLRILRDKQGSVVVFREFCATCGKTKTYYRNIP